MLFSWLSLPMKIYPNIHPYSQTSSCSSCNTTAWSQINVINGGTSFTNHLSGCFCWYFSLRINRNWYLFFTKIPHRCRWAELLGEVWKWLNVSLPQQWRTSPHFWRCTPWNTCRWGESRNPLCIDQSFCMLEGWSKEDRAMLLIQSVQLTWKLNLLPTCRSGTPFF